MGMAGNWRTAVPGLLELAEQGEPIDPQDLFLIAYRNDLFLNSPFPMVDVQQFD